MKRAFWINNAVTYQSCILQRQKYFFITLFIEFKKKWIKLFSLSPNQTVKKKKIKVVSVLLGQKSLHFTLRLFFPPPPSSIHACIFWILSVCFAQGVIFPFFPGSNAYFSSLVKSHTLLLFFLNKYIYIYVHVF